MSKETFYFSHDYNARSDMKIKRLLSKHGYLGYGLFWAIIEDLYANANSLNLDYECIAFDLRSDCDTIKSIIQDFDLFIIQEGVFASTSVQKRLNERSEKSSKAKEKAEVRWGKEERRKKANDCLLYVLRIYNSSEEFVKVGITSDSVSRRYSGKLKGYEYELVCQREMTTIDALRKESEIAAKFINYKPQIQFAGHLECLNISDLNEIKIFAMQGDDFRNPIKESKVKESKDIKDNTSIIPKKKFVKPTIPELEAYFIERCGNGNLAQKFFDSYEAKGWVVGKAPMKDWKAAVRYWLSNGNPTANSNMRNNSDFDANGKRRIIV